MPGATAWTTRLLGAHAMAEDFDRSKFGLRRGSIRLVEGLIFLSLFRAAARRRGIISDLGALPPVPTDWRRQKSPIGWFGPVKANWKLGPGELPRVLSLRAGPSGIHIDHGPCSARVERFGPAGGCLCGIRKVVGGAGQGERIQGGAFLRSKGPALFLETGRAGRAGRLQPNSNQGGVFNPKPGWPPDRPAHGRLQRLRRRPDQRPAGPDQFLHGQLRPRRDSALPLPSPPKRRRWK